MLYYNITGTLNLLLLPNYFFRVFIIQGHQKIVFYHFIAIFLHEYLFSKSIIIYYPINERTIMITWFITLHPIPCFKPLGFVSLLQGIYDKLILFSGGQYHHL